MLRRFLASGLCMRQLPIEEQPTFNRSGAYPGQRYDASVSSGAGSPETILVIDDEPEIVAFLSLLLRRHGYRVLEATTGQAGVELARGRRPDLILCDIMMPAPGGYAVRQALAAERETAEIPFAFLTALADQDNKITGLEVGVDDYITKPFEIAELVARVRAILRRDQRRRTAVASSGQSVARALDALMQPLAGSGMAPASLVPLFEDALRKRFSGDYAAEQRFIAEILGSVDRLHQVSEDLVFLYKLDQGTLDLHYESLDLTRAVLEPVAECQRRWQERQVQVVTAIDEDLVIMAPPMVFRLAISHLVDNACKFSPPRGIVQVRISSYDSGGVRITVTDQGPGIAAEKTAVAFERYCRLGVDEDDKPVGLGLGLYLTRAFARALRGDVSVIPTGLGCCIQLTIPPASEAR